MPDNRTYAAYAVMRELNSREFRRRLCLFPEEHRYQVVLASVIIGALNAGRVEETPSAVVADGNDFVAKLLDIAGPAQDGVFKDILETCLIEMMKDELRSSCSNCENFGSCLDMENMPIGDLFRRRTDGDESDELKDEIAYHVDQALQRTPHVNAGNAHLLCADFRHQYRATGLGEVFNRYADIAAELQRSYGMNYRNIQLEMVRINMDFFEKHRIASDA